jgi:hypothetical protein
MQETYGILGSGNAPKKVIEAGLKDLGTKLQYVVPWYGKITPGLEVVYDWLLDNDVDFMIVAVESGKAVPKVLAEKAVTVESVDDVNYRILKSLKSLEVPGISLIMWDTDNEEESIKISSMSIDMKLPTLELTNGLVPIIVDEQTPETKVVEPVADEDLPDIGEASYDRETLEVMPAALVKRMAKDKGLNTKTKEEAIEALSPKDQVEGSNDIGSIIVLMKDGTELGFNGTPELLIKIMELVVSQQKQW